MPTAQPPIRFELVTAPQSRLWFLSPTRTRLVQLQADLFAYNWRRTPEGIQTDEVYPRYSFLREELARRVEQLESLVAEGGRTPLRPNWCEVTYINHIAHESGGRLRLDEVLQGVTVPPAENFLPEPEDVGVNLKFVIPSEDGTPMGRLNVVLATGVRVSDLRPTWQMTLTARLRHPREQDSLSEAIKTLDIGHNWVVAAFVELTSEKLQEIWERRDQ